MLKKLLTLKILCLAIVPVVFGANAKDTKLEKAIASLGYKITFRSASHAQGWKKNDFMMQNKKIFSIKSRKKVPGEKNLYYRFAIKIEEYENEADAQKRLDYIESTPPGPNSKLEGPEYDLREGFRRGKSVYVISTNVYTFVVDKSLSKFREKLEEAIAND